MNSKQELVVMIGVFLIGLTIWQHWRDDVKAILFNSTPSDKLNPIYDKWKQNADGSWSLPIPDSTTKPSAPSFDAPKGYNPFPQTNPATA